MRGESSGLCGLCGMGRGATNAGAHIGRTAAREGDELREGQIP